MSNTFQALVVRESDEGKYSRNIEERSINELPQGEVLIRVHYSSLNYKDALSCIGNRGITHNYPHTPGIDAAGVVELSDSTEFTAGDPVLVTGHDLGMNTAGGFGQYIRVPADWVVPLPNGLSLHECMIYGTAGYTAGLSVNALRHQGVTPDQGKIVVTGATGGVGCVSVALLAGLGYTVSASTGKADATDFLTELGATEVIGREEVNNESKKPLLRAVWQGAIDTVGDNTLATLLKTCKRGGAVASTGLVASPNLPATVYPFILRGVSLLGIDSQETPNALRRGIWTKLGVEWKPSGLERIAVNRTLEELDPEIECILEGRQRGRIVVNML